MKAKTAMAAIFGGLRTVSHAKRLAVLLWVFFLLIAGSAATPAAAVIARSLGHSKWTEELLRGLDPSWVAETLFDTHGCVAPAVPVVFGLTLAMVLIGHLLIAGGAIAVFTSDDRHYTAARFFEGCGRYFWRFFRLFLLSLILCGIALLINSVLKALQQAIWGEGMVETPVFYSTRIRICLLVFLLVVVGMVTDYARIRLVVEPGRSAIRAMSWSIKFVLRNFGRCLLIWIVLMLLGAVLYLLYGRIAALAPQGSLGGALLLAGIQQVYVMSRLWLRLVFWASQAEMYLGLRPPDEVPPVPVQAYEPPLEEPASLPLPQTDEEAAGPA